MSLGLLFFFGSMFYIFAMIGIKEFLRQDAEECAHQGTKLALEEAV